MFLITTLGSYVQIEYQSKEKSPFDDHATIMGAIMVNLCLYAVTFIAEYEHQSNQQTNYLAILTLKFGPLLGFLVVVLLLVILNPLLGVIASILWVFLMLKAAIMSYTMVAQCFCEAFPCIRRYLVSEPSHSQDEHVNDSPVLSQAESNV